MFSAGSQSIYLKIKNFQVNHRGKKSSLISPMELVEIAANIDKLDGVRMSFKFYSQQPAIQ
jgi:hypothetical protein